MNIHAQLVDLIDSDAPCCALVVLSAEGSTPREAGMRAVVEEGGRIHGTVGGGAVEAEAQQAAVEALRSGQAAVLEAELQGESAGHHQPICGGRMRLLVDPTAAKDRLAYAAAATALAERQRGVLLTAIRTGATVETRVTWHSDGDVAAAERSGALADARTVRTCLTDGRTRSVALDPTAHAEAGQVLIEPVIPDPLLVIAGGGHIGQALAAQAVTLGFDVTVVDDRSEFTGPALFPDGVTTRCDDIATALSALPIREDTYVVIVTRGHQHDAEALRACIHKPAAYLGMLGSRRKVALVRKTLLGAGIASEAELDAVHAPIGLDIGAETVPEIATSIVAQLIAVRRGARADRAPRDMRDR